MSGSRLAGARLTSIVIVITCGLLPTSAAGQGWSTPVPLVQLEDGPGWRMLRKHLAWGTPLLVRRLRQVLAAQDARFPHAAPIWVHDISRRGGGQLRWHVSHRDGRDVDIRLPQRFRAGYVDATPRTLHVQRTWSLILDLIATCDVEFIMLDRGLQRALHRHARRQGAARRELELILQYPQRRSHRHRFNGVVRHYPNHRNHMHVRFRSAGAPLEQYSAGELCRRAGLPD